jgi:hypothetical protein
MCMIAQIHQLEMSEEMRLRSKLAELYQGLLMRMDII